MGLSHEDRPDWRTILVRAFRRRCPRCAADSIFATFFRLRDSCPSCSLVLRREQGAMTGQMYLSAVVTELFAAFLVLLVFFGTDWSPAVSIAVSLPLVVLFSYWFLPRAMALWVGIEFLTDLSNDEPWTRAGS